MSEIILKSLKAFLPDFIIFANKKWSYKYHLLKSEKDLQSVLGWFTQFYPEQIHINKSALKN